MRFLQNLRKARGAARLVNLFVLALVFSTTVSGQISVNAGVAPVTTPSVGFNMDGTLKANGANGDWLDGTGSGTFVLSNTGAAINPATTFHVIDAVGNADNVFVGGLKKNGNPNGYTWKSGSASPSKCNINHAIIHIAKASNGDTWITLSGDRESVTGNSFISLALHQASLTIVGNSFVSAAPSSTGGRTVGDVQVSAEFTGGGTNPNLYLEEWKRVGTSSTYAWQPITLSSTAVLPVAYGKTNSATITGMPYTVFGGTSYQTNSFIEVSFNITEIYKSSSTPCVGSIKSMLLLTKSSQSETADLSDFVTPQQVNLDITVGPPTAQGKSVCVNGTVGNLTATGTNLKWYTSIDGSGNPSGDPVATGSPFTPSINTSSTGTHNFYVTQSLDGCESDPQTVTVTVVANPEIYTLSGNQICSADGNVGVLTLSSSQLNVSYKLRLASNDADVLNSTKAGTGSALEWTGIAPGISYYVVATGATPTSCTSSSNSASVTGGESPTVYSLSGNSICASAANTGVITLSGSQTDVKYQLKNAANGNVQTAKDGTGGALTWTGLAANVNYHVVATGAAPTNCTSSTDAASITEVANPAVYNLSGNSICASAPNTGVITLSNSVTGVSYQLRKASDDGVVQSAKDGTGSSLQWTSLAAGINYYVEATGAGPTNCTSRTANASVTEVANPVVYTLSGNAICSADPNTGVVTLSNSQTGVSYQLKRSDNNNNVQDAKSGTGSALQWTELPASVNFYVLATGAAPTSCTSSTGSASVSVSTNPTQPEVEIVNPTCSKATGTVKVISPVGTGLEYSYNDGAFSPNVGPYTFDAGAGYKIEVKNTSSGCISVPKECSPEVTPLASNSVIETGAVITGDRKTKVLAAPNPFNDRVRFTMESGISGQGSLEIYNSLGQRIKVVYQGYIEAGRPMVREFTVPGVMRGMLVYVFRVGNEKVTGKLISTR